MLHDKMLPENFVHHAKNDHTNNSPKNSLKDESDSYISYSLQENDYHVLDLSKRYETKEARKTSSPYTNHSGPSNNISPICVEKCDSLPTQPSGKTLAASIQKLYAHHSLISSSTPNLHLNSSKNQSFNNSQGFPIYPIYYPQIKQEQDKDSPVFSQSYPNHANLLQSFNLIKNASFPDHMITNINSVSTNNIAPKKQSNKLESIDDKLSDSGSIPGSPTSSSTHYSIIQKASSLLSIDSQLTNSKPTRPFKAYPRDPTVIAANFAATDSLYNHSKVEQYSEYRKRILEQIRSANGGERTISNPKMRRTNNRPNYLGRSDESNSDGQINNSESEDRNGDSDNDSIAANSQTDINFDGDTTNNNNEEMLNKNNINCVKDEAYFERRRKNNAAAKKSRDRRRIKEDEIAIRAAYLERQNIELLCQLDALKSQIAALTKNKNESH